MQKCVFCGDEKKNKELIKGESGAICSACATAADEYFKKADDKKRSIKKEHEKKEEELPDKESVSASQKSDKTLNQFKEDLDKKVIGQDQAKRQLLMEFYKYNKGIQKNKNNAFLIGNSGVGKTHLVRSLSEVFGMRLIEFDATSFSETGYKGKDVLEIIEDAFEQVDQDIEALKRSVIFIDEIDKIITTTNSSGVTKVQQSLLKMTEGMVIPLKKKNERRIETVMINTKDLQFVVAGACVGLKDQIANKGSGQQIGFGKRSPSEKESSKHQKVTASDLIDYGFIPEFIGRFPLIIELDNLTKEDYVKILKDGENSVIDDYIRVFKEENIQLVINDEVVEMMADQVKNGQLGFRGVQSTLTTHLNELLYDSITNKLNKTVLDKNNLIKSDNSLTS